jgi:hypothetical protein
MKTFEGVCHFSTRLVILRFPMIDFERWMTLFSEEKVLETSNRDLKDETGCQIMW